MWGDWSTAPDCAGGSLILQVASELIRASEDILAKLNNLQADSRSVEVWSDITADSL